MRQDRYEQAGLSAEDARYASRRALGNLALAREDARHVWIWPWLDGVRQDVSYGLRTIEKNPSFAAGLILVTALGIGTITAVFGLLDGLVLKPLPVREPERLVWFRSPSFSYPIYSEVRARGSEIFSGFFAWNIERLNVEWRGEPEPGDVLTATGEFYSILGISPAAGRFFNEADDRIGGGSSGMVAVISHACWLRRFGGDPAIVGRTVRIEHAPFTIVGVTPAGFFGVSPGLSPDITIPLSSLQNRERLTTFSSAWLHLMGRLRDGIGLERANLALARIWPQVLEVTTNPGMPAERRAKYLGRQTGLESARWGFSRVRNRFEEPLWLLLGLVGLLFTVSCASAAHLLLARGVARQPEITVRLAIGASRARVFRQLMTEAFVWTALGSALAVLLASWAGSALVMMMVTREEAIVLDVGLSWRIGIFAMALTLVTTVLGSALPALRTTRVEPGATLKETGIITSSILRRWSIGKALVTAQFALTMMMLVGAALFVRSLDRVLSQDAGFDRDKVIVVATDAVFAGYTDEPLNAYHAQMRERLRSIPGVASASLSMKPPISDEDGAWTQSIAVDGVPLAPESARYVHFNAVSPGYFATLGMRVLQGRDFVDADEATGTSVAIVNESLVRRFFPDRNPMGRQISIGLDRRRQNLEIIGIVSDAKYRRLEETALSIAYVPTTRHAAGQNLFAEVRPSTSVSSVIPGIRDAVRALDPAVPLRIETVTDRIRESLVKERVMAWIASGLGIIALALACTGLYGLLAYAVSRHTAEIGLRLALGAERTSVLWMILRDCLSLAILGSVLGLAASRALSRYTRSLLYQVNPTDGVSLAAAGLVLLLVATFAGLLPARKAANIDPVVALKS
jgi:predicted permease